MSEFKNATEIMRIGDEGPSKQVFLLGQFARLVTIRNQQLRALDLAASLSKQVNSNTKIAVIGAGFAGLTCSAGLLEWSKAIVHIYDRSDTVLPVQRGCRTRFLHPFIHEWPNRNSYEDDACLPIMSWRAGFADEVSAIIEHDYRQIVQENATRYKPFISIESAVIDLAPNGKKIRIRTRQANARGRNYDYVVLATGFGDERQFKTISSPLYWENDSLDQQVRAGIVSKRKTILISGTGDGALVDVIRSLIVDARHDQLLKVCLESVSDRTAKELVTLNDELIANEELLLSNDEAGEEFLTRFRGLEARSLDSQIEDLLRSDRKVFLVCNQLKDPVLNKNAQLVNRFLISRIQQVTKGLRSEHLKVIQGKTEATGDPRIVLVNNENTGTEDLLKNDLLLVRHGPNTKDQTVMKALVSNFPDADLDGYESRIRAHSIDESRLQSKSTRISSSSIKAFFGIDQLYRLWLHNQLDNDELIEKAQELLDEHSQDPYDTAKAIQSRAELYLAERFINKGLRKEPVTGETYYKKSKPLLERAVSRTLELKSPRLRDFAQQVVLDKTWLKSICVNFDSRANPTASQDLRDKAIHLAKTSCDSAIIESQTTVNERIQSQLSLHILRVARTLVAFYQQASQIDKAVHYADILVDRLDMHLGKRLYRLNDIDIATTHGISAQNARALITFEEFNAIRRILDLWLSRADLARCNRLIERLKHVYDGKTGIDQASPFHLLRQLSRSLVLNSIGRSNTQKVIDRAQQGFALARSGFVTIGQTNRYIDNDRILAKYTETIKVNELIPINVADFLSETTSCLRPKRGGIPKGIHVILPRSTNSRTNFEAKSIHHAGVVMIISIGEQDASQKDCLQFGQWLFEEFQAFFSKEDGKGKLSDCLTFTLEQSWVVARFLRDNDQVKIDPTRLSIVLLRRDSKDLLTYARTQNAFLANFTDRRLRRLKGRQLAGKFNVCHGKISPQNILVGLDVLLPDGFRILKFDEHNIIADIDGTHCDLRDEYYVLLV